MGIIVSHFALYGVDEARQSCQATYRVQTKTQAEKERSACFFSWLTVCVVFWPDDMSWFCIFHLTSEVVADLKSADPRLARDWACVVASGWNEPSFLSPLQVLHGPHPSAKQSQSRFHVGLERYCAV